ncbi:hypothetical protein [Ferrimonas sp. YFM]|uniref:hypothetical protein n=1 Tax=Ferrimonas sp. YFM TaxID=3028878 RepID=UPI0025735ED5|nr:hypothetical protein [Ferrimonas sp. YFM]BDY04796.1 hypothetical protein F0521_18370 [Ferrimonas sp. YFM]
MKYGSLLLTAALTFSAALPSVALAAAPGSTHPEEQQLNKTVSEKEYSKEMYAKELAACKEELAYERHTKKKLKQMERELRQKEADFER